MRASSKQIAGQVLVVSEFIFNASRRMIVIYRVSHKYPPGSAEACRSLFCEFRTRLIRRHRRETIVSQNLWRYCTRQAQHTTDPLTESQQHDHSSDTPRAKRNGREGRRNGLLVHQRELAITTSPFIQADLHATAEISGCAVDVCDVRSSPRYCSS